MQDIPISADNLYQASNHPAISGHSSPSALRRRVLEAYDSRHPSLRFGVSVRIRGICF